MNTVCVIGGAAIEISGLPKKICRLRDSNIGSIVTKVSGVGYNIAGRLAEYELNVELITAFGSDSNAELIKAACAEKGIGLTHARQTEGASPAFLNILDEERELMVGISDMRVMDELTPAWLADKLGFLNSCDAVIMDANLSPKALQYLSGELTVPLIYEPVSGTKAPRIGEALSKCTILKANRIEAGILTGCSCDTVRGTYRAAEQLLSRGVKNVFISLGAEGVVWADNNGCGHLEAEPVKVVDSSGAGDAMCAALVMGYLSGKNAEECGMLGNKAGAEFCCRPRVSQIISEGDPHDE